MHGSLVAVSSGRRGAGPKAPALEGELVPGQGLLGDSECGRGQGHVRLLAAESIRCAFELHGVMALPGNFGEHLTTEGIDLLDLAPGALLWVGDALLRVVRVGEMPELARRCRFRHVSLLAMDGAACEVILGGTVRRGDAVWQLGRGRTQPPAQP